MNSYDFYKKKKRFARAIKIILFIHIIEFLAAVGEVSNFSRSCTGISRLVQYLSSYLFHRFEKSRFEENAFKVFDNETY